MKLARLILAGSLLTLIGTTAMAQQASKGMITTINRLDGTISIAQVPSGTVGDSGGGAIQQYKASGELLDPVHVGDMVTFSVTDADGKKTITKLDWTK